MKLPESRIFSYKNNNFEVPLKMATKGKGVSTILNCFNGNEFCSSLRLTAFHGQFFQLTKTDMKRKDKFGKRRRHLFSLPIYLNATIFQGCCCF